MEVLIAEHCGFCEGVERAYRIALEESKKGKNVYMLGKLVHNSQVIDKFKKLDVITVKDLSEIFKGSNGTLIISAHGVSPQIYGQAKELGLNVVDTTCPWVKKAQKIANDFADGGRAVVIVGDKDHTEVKGIVGWGKNQAFVVENFEDIKNLAISKDRKIGVLAQTTQAEEHFEKMTFKIKELFSDVKEANTICSATHKRQDAAVELAKNVDLMLVIGDKMSANTKRLYELCSQTGTGTYQIQTAGELDRNWLVNKTKMGITAGASTPSWVVDEVIKSIKD